MKPKVSIIVPNLDTRPFLPERFETIFAQTFEDWELLVYDSYSEDGAWEYIQEVEAGEPRMRAWQGPREGTPGSWSPCIREAKGEYVYIATSDDTMPPDFLEQMLGALEAHPSCDLAHCMLKAIDENGQECSENEKWLNEWLFARSSGDLLHQPHIRKAPVDGLLHLTGETVYISITQLLIRRSLFDKIGMFEKRWGSIGDFGWDMRASLVADTIHVPGTWGGWRLHSSQATAGAAIGSADHSRKIDDMIADSIAGCEKYLDPALRTQLKTLWAPLSQEHRTFESEIKHREDAKERRMFIARQLLAGSRAARYHMKSKVQGAPSWRMAAPDLIRSWLEEGGSGPVFEPVELAAQSMPAVSQTD